MGVQRPEAAPAPTAACEQDPGGQEQGRVRAGEQHKGGLWESQEHAGTLLHDQIPGERQGETSQPKGMLSLQTGRVGWLRNMTAKSEHWPPPAPCQSPWHLPALGFQSQTQRGKSLCSPEAAVIPAWASLPLPQQLPVTVHRAQRYQLPISVLSHTQLPFKSLLGLHSPHR